MIIHLFFNDLIIEMCRVIQLHLNSINLAEIDIYLFVD